MNLLLASVTGTVTAYLLGGIPTGYLAGKLLQGIDIREHGSRSSGATNVLRTLGKWPALMVLVIDVLKGAGAVLVSRWFYEQVAGTLPASAELQIWMPWVVCGWTCRGSGAQPLDLAEFFRGQIRGNGAWCPAGNVLACRVGLGAAMVFTAVLAMSRIVSLSSMCAAVAAILIVCALERPLPYQLLVIAGGLYVIALHRSNIQRLLAGVEPRLGQSLRKTE